MKCPLGGSEVIHVCIRTASLTADVTSRPMLLSRLGSGPPLRACLTRGSFLLGGGFPLRVQLGTLMGSTVGSVRGWGGSCCFRGSQVFIQKAALSGWAVGHLCPKCVREAMCARVSMGVHAARAWYLAQLCDIARGPERPVCPSPVRKVCFYSKLQRTATCIVYSPEPEDAPAPCPAQTGYGT